MILFFIYLFFFEKFNAAKVVCNGISKIKKLTETEKLGDETEKWAMKWKWGINLNFFLFHIKKYFYLCCVFLSK